MIIKTAEFKTSSPRADMCPKTDIPEYAFIGRSNVGKTMLINHFLINDSWFLVDLPGYGFAQRGKREMDKLANLINHYVLDRMQMTCLFVLIDIRHEPQKKDLDFMEFLGENGVPFVIVFTKADKLTFSKQKQAVDKYLDTIKEQWEELPRYFITSSETKAGRDEILDYIDEINRSLKKGENVTQNEE